MNSTDNGVLDAGDAETMRFAREHLNYRRDKGLDFVGRFNGEICDWRGKVIDRFSGGHENAGIPGSALTLHGRTGMMR